MSDHKLNSETLFCDKCERSAEEIYGTRDPCRRRLVTKKGRRINV